MVLLDDLKNKQKPKKNRSTNIENHILLKHWFRLPKKYPLVSILHTFNGS